MRVYLRFNILYLPMLCPGSSSLKQRTYHSVFCTFLHFLTAQFLQRAKMNLARALFVLQRGV